MKKSKIVKLVLITAALASCHKEKQWTGQERKVHVRSDSTARYASHSGGFPWLWYYAFRPYGYYNFANGNYSNLGYYSGAISEHANVGYNATKSSIIRGGFGSSAVSVSS